MAWKVVLSLVIHLLTICIISANTLPPEVNGTSEKILIENKNDLVIVSLLTDIKSLLSNSTQNTNPVLDINNNSFEQIQRNVDLISTDTKSRVNNLMKDFDNLSVKSNQNLELMLQSFSILKMLVSVQTEQFQHFLTRHERLENSFREFKNEKIDLSKLNENAFKNTKEKSVPKRSLESSASLRTESIINVSSENNLREIMDSKFEKTNSSLDLMANDIKQCKSEIRNMRSKIDGMNFKISRNEDILKNKEKSSLSPNNNDCPCTLIRSGLTRLAQENQDQKLLNQHFQDKIQQIESYKNVTGAGNFSKAMIIFRINNIEKQLEIIPTLETSINELENITRNAMMISRTVVSNTSLESKDNPLCVSPYLPGAGGCFYIHTKDRFTWLDAREHCREIQGDLASPLYFDKFRQLLLSHRLSRSYTLWVGAQDVDDEGTWKWLDNRVIDNTPKVWSTGRPNTNNRSNCMELKPAFRFVASDEDCRSPRQFVCEQRRV